MNLFTNTTLLTDFIEKDKFELESYLDYLFTVASDQ